MGIQKFIKYSEPSNKMKSQRKCYQRFLPISRAQKNLLSKKWKKYAFEINFCIKSNSFFLCYFFFTDESDVVSLPLALKVVACYAIKKYAKSKALKGIASKVNIFYCRVSRFEAGTCFITKITFNQVR